MTEHPAPVTLYDWFDRSADRYADRPALEVGDATLSSRELRQAAAAIAQLITARTATPARVGLMASRSLTAYAGHLAILRTGATVVPLNPDFPTARTAAMVQATELELIITDRPGMTVGSTPVLFVDPAGDRDQSAPETELPLATADVDDVAYIIFTSGSTGRP